MVLIRTGDNTRTRREGRLTLYEDTVWSQYREAEMRTAQLKDADYYAIGIKSTSREGNIYTVWRSNSKKRGSRRKK